MSTVTERFSAQARKYPGRVAVTAGEVSLTYQELDARSTMLAWALAEAGVQRGDVVGVCLGRGPELVVALLAALKAGAAYVPLPPDYPADRLSFVIEDTGVRVVVTDLDVLPGFTGTRLAPDAAGEPKPLPAPDPDATAYVIHTSGSTGRPKGVVVPHRNVAALLNATEEEFGFGKNDVWSLFHSFAFDFSVWEIWGCLMTGGRLVVVPYRTWRNPEELHALLAAEKVTVLNQTPSAFSQLLGTTGFAAGGLSVRLLVFGGEPLDPRVLGPWLERYPGCRVENMYGITETTVHVTRRTITTDDVRGGNRSVGVAIDGWDIYVVDERGALAGVGEPGEIYVGGAGVADGYLNRPELTEQRFVPDEITGADRKLYRSGDRGRLLANGELEHLGRFDDQVKIRGHRIELGEIRARLMADTRVTAAVAVVRDTGDPATACIDAYVTGPAEVGELRDRLAAELPAYMMPATVTAVRELPLTTNGKVDVARLPVPRETTVAADGTVEERVAMVWETVLGVSARPADNFFELGGTSLLAVRLSRAIGEVGLPALSLGDLYRNSSLAAMSELLRSRL